MADGLTAGYDFPWDWVEGYFLLFHRLTEFAEIDGTRVGSGALGTYGVIAAELSNPDVEERVISLPIRSKNEYRAVYQAQLDAGVSNGTNQLILLLQPRKGLFGGKGRALHIAAYPTGVWSGFMDAVASYQASEFRWPTPLFVFQSGGTKVFPETKNTTRI